MMYKNKVLIFCIILLVLPILTCAEGNALSTGQSESLVNILSKLFVSEFGNTIKYVNLWDGNAFNNAKPELNLVRLFDSPNTDIVLGDATKTIKNAAVLREGQHIGDPALDRGWEHIKFRHIGIDPPGTPFKYADGAIMNENEVLDLIKEGLEKGVKTNDPELNNNPLLRDLILYEKEGLKQKGIWIIFDKKTGEIITSFLNNKGFV